MIIIIKTIFILMFSSSVLASQVIHFNDVYTQPNGSTFTGKLVGDEHLSYIVSTTGSIVIKNPITGYFDLAEYSTTNQQPMLAPSGIAYIDSPLESNAASLATSTITRSNIINIYNFNRNKPVTFLLNGN